MKAGDLVLYRDPFWDTDDQEPEMGVIVRTKLNRARVVLFTGEQIVAAPEHFEVISERR